MSEEEMSLYDQVVWSEQKKELNAQEKFLALMFAGVADFVREKDLSIDLKVATVDDIMKVVKR
jgi:hypothetical protein